MFLTPTTVIKPVRPRTIISSPLPTSFTKSGPRESNSYLSSGLEVAFVGLPSSKMPPSILPPSKRPPSREAASKDDASKKRDSKEECSKEATSKSATSKEATWKQEASKEADSLKGELPNPASGNRLNMTDDREPVCSDGGR